MAFIQHISSYIPKKKITNDQISEKFPDWNSEQIFNKIGISVRNIAAEDEFVSDMAVKAVKNLLAETSIDKDSIDYVILCTQSPDYKLPTTACIVHKQLELSNSCAAIDINQGCSGYIYGLSLASSLVDSGNFKNVLLITAETYSKYIHKEDKGNISLFGDAATATLISTEGTYKIGKFSLGTDGRGAHNLMVKNGGSRFATDNDPENLDNYLLMKGREIFSFTTKRIPPLVHANLEVNGIAMEDVDQFIFHQANTFMLDSVRKKIGISKDKFAIYMQDLGNTVSSTIPLVLQHNYNEPYKRVMLVGFGVGYSWGAVVIERVKTS